MFQASEPNDMIVVLTTIPIDQDQQERALPYITDLVDHSEGEEGTVRYHAVKDITEPNLIRFIELYDSTEAVEIHTNSEPYREFIEALPEFVCKSIETIQFETDDVGVAEFSPTEAVEALD